MKKLLMMGLLLICSVEVRATNDDFDNLDSRFGQQPVLGINSDGAYDEAESLVKISNALETPVPRYRRIFLRSLARMAPPLAMAITGTILLEVAKGQSLVPSLVYPLYSDHYPTKFFFPTAAFRTVTLGQMLDAAFTYYDRASQTMKVGVGRQLAEAFSLIALNMPAFVMGIQELVKTKLWRREPIVIVRDGMNERRRMIMKGLMIGGLAVGGGCFLLITEQMWGPLVAFRTPKILEQFNISGAIELCRQHPDYGMVWFMGNDSLYSSPCAADILSQKAMPTANDLVWSLCEKVLTTLSPESYVMLALPIMFMFLNWIYLFAWA